MANGSRDSGVTNGDGGIFFKVEKINDNEDIVRNLYQISQAINILSDRIVGLNDRVRKVEYVNNTNSTLFNERIKKHKEEWDNRLDGVEKSVGGDSNVSNRLSTIEGDSNARKEMIDNIIKMFVDTVQSNANVNERLSEIESNTKGVKKAIAYTVSIFTVLGVVVVWISSILGWIK